MPRRDRRFTAEDVARIYCRHLSLPQKALARAIFEDCTPASTPDNAAVARILDLLASTLADLGVPLVPQALSVLAAAVEATDDDRIQEIIDTMGLVAPPSS